jgi:PAP2 superfamily
VKKRQCPKGRPGPPRLALLSLMALILAASVEVRAQEDPSPTPTPPPAPGSPTPAPPREKLSVRVFEALRREARRYASDSVALVKAPADWNKTEWERMGGCALIVGGLMFFDKDVDRAAQKQRSHFTDRLSGVTAALGDQYGFHVSGALLIAGAVFNHENMRESGRDAIEAGVLAYVVDTLVIKRAVGRERPFESNGRTVFVPGSSHDSFPSGHATEAFAVASVISARSKSWIIPVIAYSAATIVAIDRVNTRDHFASDVLAGAFLGSAVGHFIVNRHGEKEKGVLSKADLQLVPIRHGLAARIVY